MYTGLPKSPETLKYLEFKNLGYKTWNFEQKPLKKPGIFNNFNMFRSKISIFHEKPIT